MNARDLRDLHPDSSFRGAPDDDLPAHAPTYYDQPLLKKPHWEWEVITYLFLGGIMGGSGMLTLLADRREDAQLERSARYVSFALAAACPLVLIKHLGRPERFHHMLRIVKFKSVMSMGVWGLIAFSVPATLGAVAQLANDGLVPRPLRLVGPRWTIRPLLAVLGAFIAGYTGVLISATAIPLWAIGKRYIPAFSVCSGVAGACAANGMILTLCGGSQKTVRKLERFELVASLAELVLVMGFARHAGDVGKPMFSGARGKKLRTYTIGLGIIVPAVLNLLPFHAPPKTIFTSALTLGGGYVLRESLIEGGKDSADDPRAASRQPE